MQTESTFIENLKHQFKNGGMAIQLIFINVILFLIIRILEVFTGLSGMAPGVFIDSYISPVFGLHTEFKEFITHPWTLFTSMFTHYDIWHLLFNMIFLYFSGQLFEQLFNRKRLLYTYILGGIAGGLLEVIAHGIFPKLQIVNDIVIGASGSIMAIFIAIAFYRPNLKVNLFGILPLRIIILAGIFILVDLLALGKQDGTAHFAHLGGAILGIMSIQNIHSSGNIISRAQRLGDSILRLFSRNKSTDFKVKRGGGRRVPHTKLDEEYALNAKKRQERIDQILDKISKSGYESLTKEEKNFLFNQSKNG